MNIGLALSGGGTRAAVFHLGVLRRLADEELLDSVAQLSTVSGGTLVVAAVLSAAANIWPSSLEFRRRVYPAIRTLLTTTDLFSLRAVGAWGAVLALPDIVFHRAALLSKLMTQRWGVTGALGDLPDRPRWWINTTCLESGKNWRFSKYEMGDWKSGLHFGPSFSIADAAAASAAVPYVIGAMKLSMPEDGWFMVDPASRVALYAKERPFAIGHFWDGGAYENLGIEPLFKPNQGLISCDLLICSDASGPLADWPGTGLNALLRGELSGPRLFDLASDQIRSLRSRMLMREVAKTGLKAALLRMGNSVRDIERKSLRPRSLDQHGDFLSDADSALALSHPTELKAMSPENFDRISRHGYEVADATLTTYLPEQFPVSLRWTPVAA